mmetsp:Transcript_22127/g.51667  ORF Transcript_22127/g.51667 Transcript_22127/m.51667 type:complete len:250 (-) Transcript_22127:138-887(-)
MAGGAGAAARNARPPATVEPHDSEESPGPPLPWGLLCDDQAASLRVADKQPVEQVCSQVEAARESCSGSSGDSRPKTPADVLYTFQGVQTSLANAVVNLPTPPGLDREASVNQLSWPDSQEERLASIEPDTVLPLGLLDEVGDQAPSEGEAEPEPPPMAEQSAPLSLGSFGHPTKCGKACKYSRKARGCKDGASCTRCHLCKWRRGGSSESGFLAAASSADTSGSPSMPNRSDEPRYVRLPVSLADSLR